MFEMIRLTVRPQRLPNSLAQFDNIDPGLPHFPNSFTKFSTLFPSPSFAFFAMVSADGCPLNFL
jgi:hypothetical protein